MIVLCKGCGTKVWMIAEGICPACSVRGTLSVGVWHGDQIHMLTPKRTVEAGDTQRYACLYCRPFGPNYRARSRMKAVAQAMRPFGVTVTLHSDEAQPLLPKARFNLPQFFFLPPFLGLFFWFLLLSHVWNALFALNGFVSRWLLTRSGIKLIDAPDQTWQRTFRELAFCSRLIVIDVSAVSTGLAYEAEFIKDLHLAGRSILIYDMELPARAGTEQLIEHLRMGDPDIPLVPYSSSRLRRLSEDLVEVARHRMDNTQA